MKELIGKKIMDLTEIERDMLVESGYNIVIEDDYLYIDFELDLTIKIDIRDIILEEVLV